MDRNLFYVEKVKHGENTGDYHPWLRLFFWFFKKIWLEYAPLKILLRSK